MTVSDPRSDPRSTPRSSPRSDRRSGRVPDRRTGPLLLAAQLVFNIGFYAVVPFLAIHLRDDLGVAAGGIALALALRTFGQQGLFVLGGALADRIGPVPVILIGIAVRVLGYLGLALADGYPAVLVAAAVTGVGGALFSPALQSLLASVAAPAAGPTAGPTAGPAAGPTAVLAPVPSAAPVAVESADPVDPAERSGRRTRAFALLVLTGELGAAIGPVLGAALLGFGFAMVAAGGAAVFTVIGVVLALTLPRSVHPGRPDPTAGRPERPGWRCALADRRFLAFCLAGGTFLLAYHQLSLALPLQAAAALGPAAAARLVAAAFVIAAVLLIVGQLPIVALVRQWPARLVLPLGFACVAAGFVVVALALGAGVGDPSAALLTMVGLLTVGQLLIGPRSMDLVATFAGEGPSGAYFGLYATAGGVLTLLGSLPVGHLLDVAPLAAWWLLAALPAAAAAGLAVLLRAVPAEPAARR